MTEKEYDEAANTEGCLLLSILAAIIFTGSIIGALSLFGII